MDERKSAPQRPWHQLQPLTWLAGAVVAVSMLVVNLDGDFDPAWRRQGLQGGWRHGWPCMFATRYGRNYRAYEGRSFPTGRTWLYSTGRTSRWLRREHVAEFHPLALAGNLAVAAAIAAGVMWTVEQWSRRHGLQLRFSMKVMLAATAWAGCYVLFVKEWSAPWDLVLAEVAEAVLYVGMALAWLAAFDVMGVVWNLLARRGRDKASDLR
jgi:hypothetical protein